MNGNSFKQPECAKSHGDPRTLESVWNPPQKPQTCFLHRGVGAGDRRGSTGFHGGSRRINLEPYVSFRRELKTQKRFCFANAKILPRVARPLFSAVNAVRQLGRSGAGPRVGRFDLFCKRFLPWQGEVSFAQPSQPSDCARWQTPDHERSFASSPVSSSNAQGKLECRSHAFSFRIFPCRHGARGPHLRNTGRNILRRAAVDESLCRKSRVAATLRRSRNYQVQAGSVLRNRMGSWALVFRGSNRTRGVARLARGHFAPRVQGGGRKAQQRRSGCHRSRRLAGCEKLFGYSTEKIGGRPRP